MKRSRRKKASEGRKARGQSTESREELRTPELPKVSKDSEFFLHFEVQEAIGNLETWFAQGAHELQEGFTEGYSKFTTDLGMGLKYALNCIKKQNGIISDLSVGFQNAEPIIMIKDPKTDLRYRELQI